MAYRRKPDDCKRGKKRDGPYKVKKPQMPATSPAPIPGVGEGEASHKRHVTLLKTECRKCNPNKYACRELTQRTFSFHSKELLEKPVSGDNLLSTYLDLQYPDEVYVIAYT